MYAASGEVESYTRAQMPQYRPSKPAAAHVPHQTPSALQVRAVRVPHEWQQRQSWQTQYSHPSRPSRIAAERHVLCTALSHTAQCVVTCTRRGWGC